MKLKWLESHNRCVARSQCRAWLHESASSSPLAVHVDAHTFPNCWKPVGIPRSVCYRSSLYGRHTPHKLCFDIAFSPNSIFSFTMLPPKRIEGVFGFSAKPNISSERPTIDVRVCEFLDRLFNLQNQCESRTFDSRARVWESRMANII